MLRKLLLASAVALAPIHALAGTVIGGYYGALIQGDQVASLSVSTATTTEIVPLVAGRQIFVTAFAFLAGGTGNVKLVYGTGTNCGTGTTDLTPSFPLVAQAGLSYGSGSGVVVPVPVGKALCATTSAAVTMTGLVTYTQIVPFQ